jgi:hypothetical protein
MTVSTLDPMVFKVAYTVHQQEMIEVTLKKETNKVREKMKTEWKTSLNSRKQIFWID